MSARMEAKLSKSERKLQKKQSRARRTLLKHDGIETCEESTKILCVSNAGLDNGVAQDDVVKVFSGFGDVCEVIMLPRKPYAFVCYTSAEEATAAYTDLNGRTVELSRDKPSSVTLYLSFVSKAPENLCPSKHLPPGLILLEKFVTEEYAQELLASVEWEASSVAAQQRELKHRRVKHYGYEFKYGINNVDPDDPLPDGLPSACDKLLDKVLDQRLINYRPNQLTINQYQPGQGIPPHVDTPSAFEDGLMSLSLGSQVVMDFRHPTGQHLSVLLPPRSLMIMTEKSRYTWSHGITPRKSDIVPTPDGGLTLLKRGVRTSFTFRKLTGRKPEDDRSRPSLPDTETDAASLEHTHVHQVYEEIASHFSGTRHTPWPRIADFLTRQPAGSLLADIGCGNGKYLGINKGLFEVGADRSSSLLEICQQRNFQVFVGDVLSVPLRENTFDVCLCIAVLHHLSTQERRKKGVTELLKILRPGGQLLIYVWAMEQQLHQVKSKYLKDGKTSACCEPDQGQGNNEASCLMKDSSTPSCCCPDGPGVVDDGVENSDVLDCGAVGVGSVKHGTSSSEQSVPDRDMREDGKEDRLPDHTASAASSETASSVSQQTSQLAVHVNRTQFKQQDLLVPWQLKGKQRKGSEAAADTGTEPASDSTFHRFYHVFTQGELEGLCSEVPDCKIINSYYDQGNWAVVLEKL